MIKSQTNFALGILLVLALSSTSVAWQESTKAAKTNVVAKKATGDATDEKSDDVKKQDAKKQDAKKDEASKSEKKTGSEKKTDSEKKADSKKKADSEKKPDAEPSGPLAGHSYHGETFNEGPRSAARIIDGTGEVHFAATTDSAEAQKFIDQGVGQLHGFWYFEAERSFRQAAKLDPDCAIAYWGAAMANHNSAKRAQGFIEEAKKRLDKASPREQAYIEALADKLKPIPDKDKSKSGEIKKKKAIAYTHDLEDIIYEFPDDIDAKAFLALQAYLNNKDGVPIASYYAYDALLKDIFEAHPNHPAHHYCIHLWDRRRADMALKSAANCGQSAPGIAHMWHMPGHIFSKEKRFEDAAWQQEASARVDHAHMIRQRLMPDQIFNFAHNNEWLIRNLINVGRVDDAINLARNMSSLPRHPKYNTYKKGSAYFGRRRLMDVCEKYHRWDALLKAVEDNVLEDSGIEAEQVLRHRAIASAYLMTGDNERGTEHLDTLDEMTQKVREEMAKDVEKSVATIEKKYKDWKKDALEKKKSETTKQTEKKYANRLKSLKKAIRAAEGFEAYFDKDFKRAAEKFKDSDVDRTLYHEAMFLAGDEEKALKEIAKEVSSRKGEVIPLARQTWLLAKTDDTENAKKSLESLQSISGSVDMNSPLLTRISDAAMQLGLDGDWVVDRPTPDDVGKRPTLDSLGPMHWKSWQAPNWKLPNSEGKEVSSSSFAGKPTILIFYLGHGCLHCVEQLQAFDPQKDAFNKAGIELRAISSEDVATLKESLDSFDKEIQIPLLADSKLEVFKQFLAFDDFEEQPLHGTFLIDADGEIRWQDISYEPFMDHEFLLKEAQRLLAIGS